MKIVVLFSFVLLVMFSCNKQKTFDFPKGQWELTRYLANLDCNCQDQIDYSFYDVLPNCSTCDYYYCDYPNKNVRIDYDGSQKMIFSSDGNSETFKIKKVETKIDGDRKNYSLNLKNKKGKSFLFEYTLLNDSLLVGDFWLVGSAYATFEAPNIRTIERKFYSKDGKLITGEYSKEEILGIFKKMK